MPRAKEPSAEQIRAGGGALVALVDGIWFADSHAAGTIELIATGDRDRRHRYTSTRKIAKIRRERC